MNVKTSILLALVGSWKGLRDDVVKPLLGRVGTGLAAWLVTLGAGQELANQVGIGVIAFGLICADLFLSHIGRKEVEAKTVQKMRGGL